MPASKVLFLVNSLRTGGTERNLVSICQHIDQTRFQPEVWQLMSGGELEPKVRATGIAIRDLNRKSRFNPSFTLRAARQIAQSDAELIHVFFPTVGFYAALARTLYGLQAPLVYWMGTPHTRWFDGAMHRWFARCYNRVTANSQSVKRVGESLGFTPEQIEVLPNGHEPSRFDLPFDREGIRREFGVSSDDTMLLFVGRLIDSKRVCDAIDALVLLLPKFPRLKLIVVGEGQERRSLEAHAKQTAAGNHVRFAGIRGDVPELLRSADLFVFPSESEGLPNSVIEACLARVPIVACSVPGVTDVLTDGDHALLVPPRDAAGLAGAIERTLAEPQETKRRVVAAAEMALARYSIKRFMNELYAVYDELLAEAKRKGASPRFAA